MAGLPGMVRSALFRGTGRFSAGPDPRGGRPDRRRCLWRRNPPADIAAAGRRRPAKVAADRLRATRVGAARTLRGSRLRRVRLTRAESALQLRHEIEPFPGEAAVAVRLAAEMTVSRRALVDRLVELQRAADIGRTQREDVRQHLLELALVDLAGALGVHIERHWVG